MIAKKKLRSIVERVERLEEEKATLVSDINEVYAEAKAEGFDTKVLKKVVALRKRDRMEIEEEQALIDAYMTALGHGPLFDRLDEEDGADDGAAETARARDELPAPVH